MPGNISVLFIMELIGTAAFSCSGAMVAIKKNLDLLGEASCNMQETWGDA